MGFSGQEYWSGLLFSSPGDLSDTGVEFMSSVSPALAGRFFTTSATWEALSKPHLNNPSIDKEQFCSLLFEFIICSYHDAFILNNRFEWPSITVYDCCPYVILIPQHLHSKHGVCVLKDIVIIAIANIYCSLEKNGFVLDTVYRIKLCKKKIIITTKVHSLKNNSLIRVQLLCGFSYSDLTMFSRYVKKFGILYRLE